MNYVDLHAHPLPGIDDGPGTFAQALELLEQAWQTGTRSMVATPHMFQEGLGSDDAGAVSSLFEDFRVALEDYREVADHGYLEDFELFLGAENYAGESFLAALETGEVLTLGGSKCLLVELWPAITRATARQVVGAVQDAGLFPLLAHVERYAFLQDDPAYLSDLVTSGCLAQVNATAVLGLQGLRLAQLTDRWLRDGLVAVVASDGHDANKRKPCLDAVAQHLESRFGAEFAESCLRLNPQAILADAPVAPPMPQRRRWWRRSD